MPRSGNAWHGPGLPVIPAPVTAIQPGQIIQVSPTVNAGTYTGPLAATLPNPTGQQGASTLVACITNGNLGANVSSITLGGSADHWQNAFSSVGAILYGGMIWYDPNCAAGQTSVVVTCSGGTGGSPSLYVTVYEVAGILVFDKGSHGDSASNVLTFTSGATATTAQANETNFGAAMASNQVPVVTGAGTWTTQSTGAGNLDQVAGYQNVSSVGTATFSGTLSAGSGAGYVSIVATFYVSTGGTVFGIAGSSASASSASGTLSLNAALSGTSSTASAASGSVVDIMAIAGSSTATSAASGTR